LHVRSIWSLSRCWKHWYHVLIWLTSDLNRADASFIGHLPTGLLWFRMLTRRSRYPLLRKTDTVYTQGKTVMDMQYVYVRHQYESRKCVVLQRQIKQLGIRLSGSCVETTWFPARALVVGELLLIGAEPPPWEAK